MRAPVSDGYRCSLLPKGGAWDDGGPDWNLSEASEDRRGITALNTVSWAACNSSEDFSRTADLTAPWKSRNDAIPGGPERCKETNLAYLEHLC